MPRPAAAARIDNVPIRNLRAAPYNPRRIDPHELKALKRSVERFGMVDPIIVNHRVKPWKPGQRGLVIVGGHQRVRVARELGYKTVPIVTLQLGYEDERLLNLALNRIGGAFDISKLAVVLRDLRKAEAQLEDTGFTQHELDMAIATVDEDLRRALGGAAPTLSDRFLVPPFSVFNVGMGYWQERKAAWIGLGIHSELGREQNLLHFSDAAARKETYRRANPGDWNRSAISDRTQPGGQKYEKRRAVPIGGDHGVLGKKQLVMPGRLAKGLSVFDPVLCEIVYRWFCPPGGQVLDPFAGGSVRGIVAGALGRGYTGIELSADQLNANSEQARQILHLGGAAPEPATIKDADQLTPIQRHGDVWLKRDDLYECGGVRGGKVRTCAHIAAEGWRHFDKQGKVIGGLVTAGSRSSPQVNIVAHVAQQAKIPCRVHIPQGKLLPELVAARAAGAEVVQHKAGYNNVICARARADAKARGEGWVYIPFGMETEEATRQTARQVRRLPRGMMRIVVPVGSGMSLAGVLHGLRAKGLDRLPVLGVMVGADPRKRLDAYAPRDWRKQVKLVRSRLPYDKPGPDTTYRGVALDPIYEAKAVPYLEPGDLFWIVGIRQTSVGLPGSAHGAPLFTGCDPVMPRWVEGDARDCAQIAPGAYDLVFSCPPYGDLEQYSDDPRDLSTLPPEEFMRELRLSVLESVALLKPDRFACFVVGDYRARSGNGSYRNLVGETVRAFTDAGLELYNEAILVTPPGTLPIRVRRIFEKGRKLGKTHQNVLVFIKGDAQAATRAVGQVDVADEMGNNEPQADAAD